MTPVDRHSYVAAGSYDKWAAVAGRANSTTTFY